MTSHYGVAVVILTNNCRFKVRGNDKYLIFFSAARWNRVWFLWLQLFPRFGLSRNTEFNTLKWKIFLKMLRQYQLHGGIRRLRTRFEQSKRFGTTNTMAASAAPTPWNRPPPSIGDFRWWDEIYLKPSSRIASVEATTVPRTMTLCELPQVLLVSAVEGLVSCLDEPRFKTSPCNETLKTSVVSGPRTTHFPRDSCSQSNRPKNSSIKPIPPTDGVYRLPNRGGIDLQGRGPRRCHRCNRGGFPSNHSHLHRSHNCPRNDLSTKPIPPSDVYRGGQEPLETSDPRDIYGCYPECFGTSTMSGENEDANKVQITLPRSRSRSRSATKSRPLSGLTILEVLNSKKDSGGDKPVKGIETFASIASRPPSPNATGLTATEAAISAYTDELAAAISKHRADFKALVTSSKVKRTPARETGSGRIMSRSWQLQPFAFSKLGELAFLWSGFTRSQGEKKGRFYSYLRSLLPTPMMISAV